MISLRVFCMRASGTLGLRSKGLTLNTAKTFSSSASNGTGTHREISKLDILNDDSCDIVVAGGGMVGTTLACSLAQDPMLRTKKIVLLEGGKEQKYTLKPEYSNRVSALSEATKQLLEKLGAWQHIESVRLCQVKKMQVWEATSDAVISFSNPLMQTPVAYIVENDVLLDAVTKQLGQTTAQIRYGSKIQSCDLGAANRRPSVTLTSGKQLSCNLLIGADGAGSQIRKAIGGQYLAWNYDQMGVVATLRLSEPTENVVAWQRFLPTGPIAILPLNEEQSSLVWSLPTEEAKQVLQLPTESFVDAVNDALWHQYKQDSRVSDATRMITKTLSSIIPLSAAPGVRQLQPTIASEQQGSRAGFPLGFGHATFYTKQAAVLVGDAAHRIHPLAGQGVNLGFGDVQSLSEILSKHVQNGGQLGQLKPLLDYERSRQMHNLPLMLGVDGLHRLYTSNNPAAAIARGVGVTIVDALTPLKGFFAKYAAT